MNNLLPTPPGITITAPQDEVSATLAVILRQMKMIEELKHQKYLHHESLRNILKNSVELKDKEEIRKKAAVEVNVVKERMMVMPEATNILEKIDDVTAELKSAQEDLSTKLMVYHTKTGKTTFEDDEGQERTLLYKYKVKPIQMSMFDKETLD